MTILREYALAHFPATDVIKYALEVEKITTSKRENLILNVDGCVRRRAARGRRRGLPLPCVARAARRLAPRTEHARAAVIHLTRHSPPARPPSPRSLIAVAFVDLIRGCGAFTREEADETLESGFLNGIFVVARSIGFIGHAMDQRRLKQGLYRHETGDIVYMQADN